MGLLINPTQMTFSLVIGNWPACKGIQKLTGFTRGLSFHKVDYFPYWHISNSIVLGYNRDSEKSPIRLWMYCYVDGKHIQKPMGLHEVGTVLKVELNWKYGDMSIFNGKILEEYETIFGCGIGIPTKTLPIGWQLFPYAEIDGTEKRSKLNVEITDLKIR